MKKVSPAEQPSSTSINFSDALNPEESQTRCKICFQQKMPLVTLCECTGSIAYVHEDCILDWIALKMEKSELIEIPKCEICKTKFSAALKIGSKKIDNSLLMQKIKSTTRNQWIIFVTSIVALIIAFTSIFLTVFSIFLGNALHFDSVGAFAISAIQTGFLQIGFPIYYMKERSTYFQQKGKILEACKVQLVEVTLLPKKILKS